MIRSEDKMAYHLKKRLNVCTDVLLSKVITPVFQPDPIARLGSSCVTQTENDVLHKFWDLESIGIKDGQ